MGYGFEVISRHIALQALPHVKFLPKRTSSAEHAAIPSRSGCIILCAAAASKAPSFHF